MTVDHWLLDSDPSISWQFMRDLLDQPSDAVAAERTWNTLRALRVLRWAGGRSTWGSDA